MENTLRRLPRFDGVNRELVEQDEEQAEQDVVYVVAPDDGEHDVDALEDDGEHGRCSE